MYSLNGCTALITGASAGIGREIARQLGSRARTLVLVARRGQRLEELKQELLHINPRLNVHFLAIDLADLDSIDVLLNALKHNDIQIDLLVNNAGVGDHGDFCTSDWARVKRIIDLNITALTRLTHALLPMLLARERAAILNVSSVAGFLPVPQMAVYAATKAFVTSFSEALRAELSGTGVSVSIFCPGPVDTEFGSVARRESGERLPAPDFFKVPVEKVAACALDGVSRGCARMMPGWQTSIMVAVISLVPMVVLRFFLNRYHQLRGQPGGFISKQFKNLRHD